MKKVYVVNLVGHGRVLSRRYYFRKHSAYKYFSRVSKSFPDSYIRELEYDPSFTIK